MSTETLLWSTEILRKRSEEHKRSTEQLQHDIEE